MTQKVLIRYKDRKFMVEGAKNLWEGRDVPGIGRVLHFVEVAYLLYTQRAELICENGMKLNFEEFFSKFGGDRKSWILFAVYYDLRKRGRKVRPGITESDLIIENKSTSMRIFVTEENTQLQLKTVMEWIEDSLRKGYKPYIAVVDMYGDVTYYEVSKISLPRISSKVES